jgi:hypothetical protein
VTLWVVVGCCGLLWVIVGYCGLLQTTLYMMVVVGDVVVMVML